MASTRRHSNAGPGGCIEQWRDFSPHDEVLLTVTEVAHWLQLRPKTIYAWAASRRIPCVRIGNRIRFRRYEVLRWIEARKEG